MPLHLRVIVKYSVTFSLFHHSPLHLDTSPIAAVPIAANAPATLPPSTNAPITTTARQRATIPLAEVTFCWPLFIVYSL